MSSSGARGSKAETSGASTLLEKTELNSRSDSVSNASASSVSLESLPAGSSSSATTSPPAAPSGSPRKASKHRIIAPFASPSLSLAQSASASMGIPYLRITTDTSQNVIDVNDVFESFTGFTKGEVMGRKCTFLQGEETDPEDLLDLRTAVQSGRETSVVILNYTKSGSRFWNLLSIRPVFHADRSVTSFIGDIISLPLAELTDRSGSARPRLCLDDALAFIRAVSSVPKSLPMLIQRRGLEDEDEEEEAEALARSVSPQRHVHYPRLLEAYRQKSQSTVSTTDDPSSSSRTTLLGEETNQASSSSDPASTPPAAPTPPSGRSTPASLGSTSSSSFVFVAETLLPTKNGRFRVRAYRDDATGAEPLALICGNIEGKDAVLCRAHDQCQTSEVFGSLRCDCKEQLDAALARIQQDPEGGMLIYLPQEGRGIGLANKVAAYAAQEMGLDTVDANRHLGLPDDAREYGAVRDILLDLGIRSIRLMTNNPRKMEELERLGIRMTSREPIVTPPNSDFSKAYVLTKAERMKHMILKEDLEETTTTTTTTTAVLRVGTAEVAPEDAAEVLVRVVETLAEARDDETENAGIV